MENKNLIRLAESIVLLPFLTVSLPLGALQHPGNTIFPQTVLSQKENIRASDSLAFNREADAAAQILEAKAAAIDAYFKRRNMPLLGTGIKMVQEAEKNNLDWRLLAAIAVRESTGGKYACQQAENNPLGWGSCKISFGSINEAIETVAKNLGGNNPNTAKHYSGKNTKEILQKYNPPHIVRRYAEQVMSIMENIGPENLSEVIVLAKV